MQTIVILGGGASGLAAALAAREQLDNRVIVLERQNRVARKLMATGNGRCNLSNRHVSQEHYHGDNTAFVLPALTRFPVSETLGWFAGLGLMTTDEPSGRIYPVTDTAGSVTDVLRLALEARGGEVICGFTAAKARKIDGHFLVTSSLTEEIECDKLIVACGGMAGARIGGVKDGYDLLRSFGHSRTALHPALVQFRTDPTYPRGMKGVRTQAHLTLRQDDTDLAEASGEVQFTDYGITGPGVFDLSRAASIAGEGCTVALRLLPDVPEVDIIHYMTEKRSLFPDYKAENLFSGALHNSIGRTLLRRADIPLEARLWALSEGALERLAELIDDFTLPLLGTQGFDDAQVTAGGTETSGFDPNTMESRLVPGLYACGEVLDIDGDCGGYNLQWAWSSGRLAGSSAAEVRE